MEVAYHHAQIVAAAAFPIAGPGYHGVATAAYGRRHTGEHVATVPYNTVYEVASISGQRASQAASGSREAGVHRGCQRSVKDLVAAEVQRRIGKHVAAGAWHHAGVQQRGILEVPNLRTYPRDGDYIRYGIVTGNADWYPTVHDLKLPGSAVDRVVDPDIVATVVNVVETGYHTDRIGGYAELVLTIASQRADAAGAGIPADLVISRRRRDCRNAGYAGNPRTGHAGSTSSGWITVLLGNRLWSRTVRDHEEVAVLVEAGDIAVRLRVVRRFIDAVRRMRRRRRHAGCVIAGGVRYAGTAGVRREYVFSQGTHGVSLVSTKEVQNEPATVGPKRILPILRMLTPPG